MWKDLKRCGLFVVQKVQCIRKSVRHAPLSIKMLIQKSDKKNVGYRLRDISSFLQFTLGNGHVEVKREMTTATATTTKTQSNKKKYIKSVCYAKQITLLTINEQNGTQLRRAFFILLLLAIDSIKTNAWQL